MLETLRDALKTQEMRKKILFTLMMFLIFRIGSHIPVPGIDKTQIAALIEQIKLLGFFDTISGSALKNVSIFAMSITPYINASIIIQLLTVIFPRLEAIAKDDRKKIVEYTRYLTVGLGFIQALGMAFYFRNSGAMADASVMSMIIVILSLTAGTACLMWIGELITEKGIGNGISLIIFAGIVSRIPGGIAYLIEYAQQGVMNIVFILIFLVVALAAIICVIIVNQGERRVPVQYAKRVVGRKMYGGQSTHIPIKVNSAGVIPVIFAMSLMFFPGTIASFFPDNAVASWISQNFSFDNVAYNLIYAVLIIFFTYFYSSITFNPIDVADNIRKNGGFIPGIRPGRPTSEYIMKVMSRITFFGGLFLACIAVLPAVLMGVANMDLYFGGTSLLIVVGVAIDTMKQIESNMMMRNYEGFMK
ncbi:MAG: preprotein translocase subunit SecY [Peptococcaceae bacterium]|jgi:preprotein translocase subunit SecY|nr:preprotein translocase subunit SecY [Peptococcaceae bacterium]